MRPPHPWGTTTRGELSKSLRLVGVRLQSRERNGSNASRRQYFLEREGLQLHFFYTDGSDDDWIDQMSERLFPDQVDQILNALRVDPRMIGRAPHLEDY